jgi:predicted outer membrane repeat protein
MVSHGSSLRITGIFGALLLVAGMLAVLAPSAGATAGAPCRVTNLSTGQVYTGTGSNLETAIDAAMPGTKLRIRGLCVGNYLIAKNLKLIGWPTAAYPTPTLDGNASGTVLTVNAGSVRLRDLTITNAGGGGILNDGTLFLDGSSSVSGNTAENNGGGIYNNGTLTLNGSSSVSGNTNGGTGGGILSFGTVTLNGTTRVSGNSSENGGGVFVGEGGILTMNDFSSVSGNIATRGGGGISSAGTITMNDFSSVSGNTSYRPCCDRWAGSGGGIENYTGTLTMNDSSSVAGNTADAEGGGIYDYYGPFTMNDSSSVTGNRADFDNRFHDQGGGILSCHDTLMGAVDGGNVNDNYLGSAGTNENNISSISASCS